MKRFIKYLLKNLQMYSATQYGTQEDVEYLLSLK